MPVGDARRMLSGIAMYGTAVRHRAILSGRTEYPDTHHSLYVFNVDETIIASGRARTKARKGPEQVSHALPSAEWRPVWHNRGA